jgi:hypothetical protein
MSTDVTLTVAKMASLVASIVAAVYAGARLEPSPVVGLFLSSGPAYAVILWLQKDAHRTGVGDVLDLGYFLLLAWPIVIPWYAFKTRGPSGWRLTAELFGLIGAPWVTFLLVALAASLT